MFAYWENSLKLIERLDFIQIRGNLMEDKIITLLEDVRESNLDEVSQKLSALNQVPFLINIFNELSAIQKIAVLQVGLHSKNKQLQKFLVQVAGDESEDKYVRNIARGILDSNLEKNCLKTLETIKKRFFNQEEAEQITDLALLGFTGNKEALSFLQSIKTNSKIVDEQRNIAILQIKKGLSYIISLYKSNDHRFSVRGLREALYASVKSDLVKEVILNDLFADDSETLMDTTTIIRYDPNFDYNLITIKEINRLFEIIQSDYPSEIKENCVAILAKFKADRTIKDRLYDIYINKRYLYKNNLMNKLKYMDVKNILKEVVEK